MSDYDDDYQQPERSVEIAAGRAVLEGNLVIPQGARGVVLFAHGSGSSRFSRRNRYVAQQLSRSGLATLLIDLLTRQEEMVDQRTAQYRFEVPGALEIVSGLARNWFLSKLSARMVGAH